MSGVGQELFKEIHKPIAIVLNSRGLLDMEELANRELMLVVAKR
jgi:hypothetical protein